MEKAAARILDNRKNIIAISFDPLILDRLKQINPRIVTGFLFSRKVRVRRYKEFFKFCGHLKIRWLLGKHRALSPEFIQMAHKKRIKVSAWVVNRKRRMKKLISWGVDGIASDRPDLFNFFIGKQSK